MEVNECYICNDEKNDILMSNICECKDKYIHKSCFIKLLNKVEKTNNCSVCKTTYKNVIIQKKCIPNIKVIFIFSFLNILFVFSLVLFINRVYYFYIKLCTSEDYICKRETNFTIINNTEGYIKCKTMLAEHNFASLVLSIVFTFINTFFSIFRGKYEMVVVL